MTHDELTLIRRLASRYARRRPWIDVDDLVQEGAIALMLARERYDAGHSSGATLISYAYASIRHAMRRSIGIVHTRHEDGTETWHLRIPTEASLDAPLDESRTLHEVVGQPATQVDDLAREELRAYVRRVVDGLPANERLVFTMQLEGGTQESAGRALGVSRQRAQQIEREALPRLRARLAGLRAELAA